MSSHTVRNCVDVSVTSAIPAGRYTGPYLRAQAPGTATKYIYIWFKSPVPPGATVSSALLKLYEIGSFGTSVTVNVQRVSAKWTESTIDYNNRPGVTGTVATLTLTGSADATEWAVDVTALVQDWADGSPVYGLRVSTTSTTERKWYSHDATDNKPILVVDWSDAPDIPTGLVPSGGSSVSLANPVLSYNYHDPNGSDLIAQNIQIKATNTGWTQAGGFASPDFDTTALATEDPELDTSTTAWAGITAGTTKYWTVKVENASGRWSGWSDPVAFTRTSKVTVTINNPAVSPNNFVSDTTPELSWTVTGGSQVARRVIIYDESDLTSPVLDTGRIHTTATTYTPPEGVITDDGATYRLVLRTHDDDNRVNTPGDTVYIETARSFTFVDDPTPNPVTGLTAVQQSNGLPHVLVNFSRATAPDAFVVFRNGKRFATYDPADVFVSGTSYQIIDRGAPPNQTWTYKVRCRVTSLGVTSLSQSAATSISYTAGDVWLSDWSTPSSSRLVCVKSNLADLTFDMPEVAALFTPINGNHDIRIVQGQQGLKGHVEGRIVDRAGLTATAAVANLLWMKARPDNELRLVLGDQNLRVELDNVVVAPLATGHMADRRVSFDFRSLDGPAQ